MTLIEKLKNISKPPIKPIQPGYSETLNDFWNDFIFPRLPKKDVALQWHKVLMEYVNQSDVTFACRFYNTAPKDKYNNLRRGFLTKTDKNYSFFYTDNYHAAYYFKMALDGYIPDVEEIISAYKSRKFPARFGQITSEEKELMAMPNKFNPGFTNSKYKIAHIYDVGRNYIVDGKNFSLKDIVEKYFLRGERSDWIEQIDSSGKYFLRELNVSEDARKYLTAEFLRFVHPFNYFLMPTMIRKNSFATWACLDGRKDAAEYFPLLSFVQKKFSELYGQSYDEFLDLIMVDRNHFEEISGDIGLKIEYGICTINTEKTNCNTKKQIHTFNKQTSMFSTDIKLRVLKEFLRNPNTSFRRLESEIMNIESPARGGGFKAKKIVNDYGAVIENKGILYRCPIDDAIKYVSSNLAEILRKHRNYFEC